MTTIKNATRTYNYTHLLPQKGQNSLNTSHKQHQHALSSEVVINKARSTLAQRGAELTPTRAAGRHASGVVTWKKRRVRVTAYQTDISGFNSQFCLIIANNL